MAPAPNVLERMTFTVCWCRGDRYKEALKNRTRGHETAISGGGKSWAVRNSGCRINITFGVSGKSSDSFQ